MGFIKGIFNASPIRGCSSCSRSLRWCVLVWKREQIASNAVGYGVLGLSRRCSSCFGTFDPNFRLIVTKPDNVPIVGLIFLLVLLRLVSRCARRAERPAHRRGAGPDREGGVGSRLVWPDLVYTELISLIVCSVVLIVWSIFLKAPLEQPANPANTPNPSKAPWYFLGLQEMLVYFDPWLAGVVLPGLIIVGLIGIPYIDKNPKGNGYYTFNERKAEITIFLFGFVVLWCVADRARHVPARPELELLRAVRVLGHPQARGAEQRQPVRIHLGRVLRDRPADATGSSARSSACCSCCSTSSRCRCCSRRRCSRRTTRSWARRATT